MAATPEVLAKEAAAIFQNAFKALRGHRSRFKEAMQFVARQKMPHATETTRAKFVNWAMKLYDYEIKQTPKQEQA